MSFTENFKYYGQQLLDSIDGSVFITSISDWIGTFSINKGIVFIMMIFMLVGAIDKIRGNKLGYGEKFDEGMNAMGPLAAAMAGVIAAAPVLSLVLSPIVVPVYSLLGADPSMFATTFLACDMGGYSLAQQMAQTVEVGEYAGLILGSMMGPTIVFTIPVALSIIKKDDRAYLGAGILAGMITIPIGCVAGGLAMNLTTYRISIGSILINLVPVILIAGLIILGLWFKPVKMISSFNKFGTGITIVITALTAIAVFEYETGILFPLLDQMVQPDSNGVVPLESGLLTCGQIAVVLIGAYPMVEWITRHFGKLSTKLGINAAGSTGLVATLANNIPMFSIMEDMDPKGKLVNIAFAVSAAFVFGDHLGFCAANNPEMITPMIIGKLVAGITAFFVANLLSSKLLSKIEETRK